LIDQPDRALKRPLAPILNIASADRGNRTKHQQMRILVINPNTSVAVTEIIVAEARRSAPPQVAITGVTARFGTPLIRTPEQSDTAGQAVLELVNRLASGFDAVIIAAFSDPGLAEARAVSPVPVVGIAESAMLTALMCGGRFAIVTLGPALRPLLEMAAQKLGCANRLTAIHVLDTGSDSRTEGKTVTALLNDHGKRTCGTMRQGDSGRRCALHHPRRWTAGGTGSSDPRSRPCTATGRHRLCHQSRRNAGPARPANAGQHLKEAPRQRSFIIVHDCGERGPSGYEDCYTQPAVQR